MYERGELYMRKRNVAAAVMAGVLAASALLTGCGGGSKQSAEGGSQAGSAAAGGSSSDGSEYTKENPLELKMALVEGTGTVLYEEAQAVVEKVLEKTDGRIKINVIAGGALGGERDTLELLMSNDLDMTLAANSVLTNWVDDMAILDRGFIFDTYDQAHAAVDGELGELIKDAVYDKMKIHVVGYLDTGFRDIFSTREVSKLADFNGLKIRTMNSPYQVAIFQSFGAIPTPMAFGEQFTALQQGTIDACENGVSACYTNGFYEVTRHITNSHHSYTYLMMNMSDKAYNMIPEDLRGAFEEGIKEGEAIGREYLQQFNADTVEKMKADGVTFHEIDRDAMKKQYEDYCAEQGYTFNETWQAAIDKAIEENPA